VKNTFIAHEAGSTI